MEKDNLRIYTLLALVTDQCFIGMFIADIAIAIRTTLMDLSLQGSWTNKANLLSTCIRSWMSSTANSLINANLKTHQSTHSRLMKTIRERSTTQHHRANKRFS